MSKVGALINASCKWLKVFLALGVRKLGFPIAIIFGKRVNFLDEFLTVSLALSPSLLKTSLSSVLNAFGANSLDDLIVFNIKVSSAAIPLKLLMKC